MSDVAKPGLRARRGLLCLALGGLLSLPLIATVARADGEKADVKIDNFTFKPAELRIKVGTEVTWTNEDDIPHTVVAIGSNLRSKTIDTDKTFTFKFDKPGTYNYMCGLHPHMKGKVIVSG